MHSSFDRDTGKGRAVMVFAALLMVVSLACCSTPLRMQDDFDTVTRAYGDVLRWKKFEGASSFASSQIRDEFEERMRHATDVVVVDYRIINSEYDETHKKASVNAEISYHTLSSLRVRAITDKQTWSYVEEDGSFHWRLMSLLPEFK
ncbi:MAG: hypothetical protein ACM34I_00600 [bacterium]